MGIQTRPPPARTVKSCLISPPTTPLLSEYSATSPKQAIPTTKTPMTSLRIVSFNVLTLVFTNVFILRGFFVFATEQSPKHYFLVTLYKFHKRKLYPFFHEKYARKLGSGCFINKVKSGFRRF
jgi:hypothetical protein